MGSRTVAASTNEPLFTLKPVSRTEVTKVITSLKASRAKDVYGMDTFILKEVSPSIVGPLTHIINTSLSQGRFPKSWKSAAVVPVFKDGNPCLTSTYRPISILPTVSKVFEKLVAKQIINHPNNSPFALHPMQFGFRANHSTETATCYFVEKVNANGPGRGAVGAVFLDLRKAFDTVNHSILLKKLLTYNLSTNCLNLIQSYLSSRSQLVKNDHHSSNVLQLSTGVPQGSVLGPLLFSMYINDLPTVWESCDLMYADDTVILGHGKTAGVLATKLTDAMLKSHPGWISAVYS